MPPRIARIVVVVPAHDERDRIAACVDSVIASAQLTGLPATVRVILDACIDDTAAMVPAGCEEVGVVKPQHTHTVTIKLVLTTLRCTASL